MKRTTWFPAAEGQKRATSWFAWWPVTIGNDSRWLERVTVEWEFARKYAFLPPCSAYLKWQKMRFVDKNEPKQEPILYDDPKPIGVRSTVRFIPGVPENRFFIERLLGDKHPFYVIHVAPQCWELTARVNELNEVKYHVLQHTCPFVGGNRICTKNVWNMVQMCESEMKSIFPELPGLEPGHFVEITIKFERTEVNGPI